MILMLLVFRASLNHPRVNLFMDGSVLLRVVGADFGAVDGCYSLLSHMGDIVWAYDPPIVLIRRVTPFGPSEFTLKTYGAIETH